MSSGNGRNIDGRWQNKDLGSSEIIDVNATYEGELPGQQGLPKAKERLPFEPVLEELPESNLQSF